MARNGSGTYNPPAGNPVTVGTTILASWANSTIGDIGAELTNSLPRDGQASMTGALKIIDGSSTIPGFSFNSESGTGIFRPGVGQLAITNSGVVALTTNAGNVTIAGGLTASGTSVFNGNVGIGGAGVVNSSLTVRGTNNSLALGYATGGNGGYLDLSSNGAAGGFLWANHYYNAGDKASTAGYSPSIELRMDSGVTKFMRTTSVAADAAISQAESMRIDAVGNVGIGVSPTSKFQVQLVGSNPINGATIAKTTDFAAAARFGFNGLATNNDGVFFGMGADGTGIPGGIGFMREATGWNTALAFYTNNITSGPNGTTAIQEKMRIDSAGNVGIGITPTNRLHVTGTSAVAIANLQSTSGEAYLKLTAPSAVGGYLGYGVSGTETMTFLTNNAEKMRITPTGLVGIGTTAPGTLLDVSLTTGDVASRVYANSAAGGAIQYLQAGNGATSSKYAYTSYVNSQTAPQQWRVGTNGSDSFSIYDATAVATRLAIDTAGNVSIGSNMVVGAGAGARTITANGGSSSASDGGVLLTQNSGVTSVAIGNASALVGGAYSNDGGIFARGNMRFYSNGSATEAMRLDSVGRLKIGSAASPVSTTVRLSIQGDASYGGAIEFANVSGGGGILIPVSGGGFQASVFTGVVGSETYAAGYTVDATGQVGVGLTPATTGNNRGLLQLLGSANGGIYLGNTANAATNVLDHYEEGTFTFVPVGLSTAGAPTGTTINGNFIRIGKMVHITGTASWTTHTGTGTLQMSGLPYAVASVMPVTLQAQLIGPTYSGIPMAEIQIGTSNIRIVQQASGGGGTYLSVPSGATTININGSYFVA